MLQLFYNYNVNDWKTQIRVNHHEHLIYFTAKFTIGGNTFDVPKNELLIGFHTFTAATSGATSPSGLINTLIKYSGTVEPSLRLHHDYYAFWGCYKYAGTWYFARVNLDLNTAVIPIILNMTEQPIIYNWNTTGSGTAFISAQTRETQGTVLKIFRSDQAGLATESYTSGWNDGGALGFSVLLVDVTSSFGVEPIQTAIVDSTGRATFSNLLHNQSYVVSAQAPGKDESFKCNPIKTSIAFGNTTHARQFYFDIAPETVGTVVRQTNNIKERKYKFDVYVANNIPTAGTVNFSADTNFGVGGNDGNETAVTGGRWLREGRITSFVKDLSYPTSGELAAPFVSMSSRTVDVPAITGTVTETIYTSHAQVAANINQPDPIIVTYGSVGWNVGDKVYKTSTIGDCDVAASIAIERVTTGKSVLTDATGTIVSIQDITAPTGNTTATARILEPAINSGKVVQLDSSGSITNTLIDIDTTLLASYRIKDNQWDNKSWKTLAEKGLSTTDVFKRYRFWDGPWVTTALDETFDSDYDNIIVDIIIQLARISDNSAVEEYRVKVGFKTVLTY